MLVRSIREVQIIILRFGGRGEVCSNQSVVIWGRGLAKSSYNLYSGWKFLIYSSFCSIYGIWGGGGCPKMSYGGKGLAKKSEYRHMRGRGLNLLKEPSYDIWTFPKL